MYVTRIRARVRIKYNIFVATDAAVPHRGENRLPCRITTDAFVFSPVDIRVHITGRSKPDSTAITTEIVRKVNVKTDRTKVLFRLTLVGILP